MVLEIMLTNNGIKYIFIKKFLENRGILLKRFLRPLMRIGFPLLKNVLTPLAKSALMPLQLAVAVSATGATIQKKIFGSGITTPII